MKKQATAKISKVLKQSEAKLLKKSNVVEVGKIRSLASNRMRARPALGGASIGHFQITAGTLGCLVKDKKTGKSRRPDYSARGG